MNSSAFQRSLLFAAAVSLSTLGLYLPQTQATTFTWTQVGSGSFDWNDATSNWTSGFPNAVSDVANLTADLTANQTISVNQAVTLGSLNIGDPTSSYFAYTLAPNGGSLTFDNGGSAALLTTSDVNSNVTNSISTGVTLASNLSVSVRNTNSLAITGNIGESAGGKTLTQDGNSTLILSGANTYSGLTTATSGTLQLDGSNSSSGATAIGNNVTLILGTGANNGLASGNLSLNASIIRSSDNNTRTITNALTLQNALAIGASQGASTGLGDLTFTSASAFGNGVLTVTNATTATFSGVMDFGNNLIKSGTGTLVLANSANTGGNLTRINGGVLSVGKLSDGGATSSLGSASSSASNLVLNGGTLRYTGTGDTTNKLFTIHANGGAIDSSGTSGLQFTATGTHVTADPASRAFELTSGSTQAVYVFDKFDLAVGMAVSGTGIAPGTTITAIGEITVTLSQAATVTTNSNPASFAAWDRVLTLKGSNIGNNTIAGILTDSAGGAKLGVTKTGSGTWALTGANTFTGATTIASGTLILGNNSATATFLSDSSNLYLNTGGLLTLSFSANSVMESIAGLYIDGVQQAAGTWGAIGSGATYTSSLIAGTGMLNVLSAIPEPATSATIFGSLILTGSVLFRRRRASRHSKTSNCPELSADCD
jgi:autotransporter-associated beta strand protein